MFKSLNTAATGMIAQQSNMDVLANNIANVNTVGFKKSKAEFEDLIYSSIKDPGDSNGYMSISPNGVQTGLGVRTASIKKDFSDGSAQMTKNPLDIQIEGAGFFQIKMADGEMAFTRDGSFRKSAEGKIVDKNGNSLIPEISIPEGVLGIEVTSTGEVRCILSAEQGPQVVGQLEVAQFVNPAGLKSLGKNLFQMTAASGQPNSLKPGTAGTGFLAQGQLEGSNVNIVDEMINMIAAQRAYETNSKVIQTSDQMLQTAVNVK